MCGTDPPCRAQVHIIIYYYTVPEGKVKHSSFLRAKNMFTVSIETMG